MEENQRNGENVIIEEKRCETICTKHPFLKSLLCGLLIFLGAYCAFYTVADWHMKTLLPPAFRPHRPSFERMMMKDFDAMNNMMIKEEKRFAHKTANVIHLEQAKDAYRILIDLRAFDNNENNVQVSTNGNILTINGRSIRKSKNNEQISEFQQNFMFGNNVRLKDLTKETNGHYYVITIPIGENDNED